MKIIGVKKANTLHTEAKPGRVFAILPASNGFDQDMISDRPSDQG
jgi:hypothetical protein